jgi:hypothetical protein
VIIVGSIIACPTRPTRSALIVFCLRYITKGDHNDVIDQMAGQMFGMANASYIESHRDEIINESNQSD